MAIDKETNTQVLLTISYDLLKLVETFQFENRIPSRSEAIRILLSKSLEAHN